MKLFPAVLAATIIVAGAAGVVAADTGPLADAGLDQEVAVDTTVQLDGTGSSHPDGDIDGYRWSIETPAGRTITPDCAGCARTRFAPGKPGRYDVTLTVTDAEGRSDTDTLYVFVEAAGPTVDLDGPTEPAIGEETSFNASAETTNAELENVTWKIDNETVAREPMNGTADRTMRSFSFPEHGTYVIEVIVLDSNNRSARDVLTVEPWALAGRGQGSGADNGSAAPSNDFETDESHNDSTPTCSVDRRVAKSGYACVGTVGANESEVGAGAAYAYVCEGDNVSCHGNSRSKSGGTGRSSRAGGGTSSSSKPTGRNSGTGDSTGGSGGSDDSEAYGGTDAGRTKPEQSTGF